MKKSIETLTTARQITKVGRTYINDCNSTIQRIDEFGYKFHATKHDYLQETKKFKTFKGLWNYLYLN